MYGYCGKLLRVNLSELDAKVEPIPEQLLKDFLGGRGLGISYLYKELVYCLTNAFTVSVILDSIRNTCLPLGFQTALE